MTQNWIEAVGESYPNRGALRSTPPFERAPECVKARLLALRPKHDLDFFDWLDVLASASQEAMAESGRGDAERRAAARGERLLRSLGGAECAS